MRKEKGKQYNQANSAYITKPDHFPSLCLCADVIDECMFTLIEMMAESY
jgi:hypothetical protein